MKRLNRKTPNGQTQIPQPSRRVRRPAFEPHPIVAARWFKSRQGGEFHLELKNSGTIETRLSGSFLWPVDAISASQGTVQSDWTHSCLSTRN